MRFNKPCTDCGKLTKQTRCEQCQKQYEQRREGDPTRRERKARLYGPNYRRLAPQVKANATLCHICQQGSKPDDPWEADHLYPELGDQSPLAPAHRSCNQKRGNKPIK